MKKDLKQKAVNKNFITKDNIVTLALTTLSESTRAERVIRAGGKGCRKNHGISGLLKGKMLLVADRRNKLLKSEKEGSKVLFRDLILTALSRVSEKFNINGGENMKNTGKIYLNHVQYMVLTGVLTLGVLALFCVPQITGTTHAQSYSSHFSQYHGMANLAEQEIRKNEQEAKKADKLNIAGSFVVADDEKEDVRSYGETGTPEKTDETGK